MVFSLHPALYLWDGDTEYQRTNYFSTFIQVVIERNGNKNLERTE